MTASSQPGLELAGAHHVRDLIEVVCDASRLRGHWVFSLPADRTTECGKENYGCLGRKHSTPTTVIDQ